METNDGFPPGLRFEMPPPPPLNLDELDAVLRHVAAHPEEWDQDRWCGSACCVAGHVVRRTGVYEVVNARGYVLHVDDRGTGWRPEHVFDVAQRILGISNAQAAALFAPRNRLSTLRTMAAALRFDRNADLSRVR